MEGPGHQMLTPHFAMLPQHARGNLECLRSLQFRLTKKAEVRSRHLLDQLNNWAVPQLGLGMCELLQRNEPRVGAS
jgi:hypothetical protein